ncbi:MAG: hypothetical protein HY073_04335 [Deltaproteobacteria bacterium]|nr:hypothetical protein [Deltaproteobacteria bacterium]
MAKLIETVTVPNREFTDYREKGLQFFRVMKTCLQDSEWDAVFLNGVHAAITLSDALAVFRLGKRSKGKSHQDATVLLGQIVSQEEEGKRYAARLSAILNWKNEAEYDSRRFTEQEAYRFAQSVERFMEWIQKQLPS